jgi:hypothetical protein
MKVMIYIEDVLGVHYATNVELATKHLGLGDEVHFVVCHGSLQSCPCNDPHDRLTCVLCKSKLRVGLSADLMARVKKHVLNLEHYVDSIELPEFASIDELKTFSIDGVNHGMEAASSVISALRDPRPDMRVQRALARRTLFTSVAVFRSMLELIDQIKPDLCYVLNGRRASQMPAVRALERKGIRFSTFEVGHNWQRYILIEGTYFHDLDNKKRQIESYWENQVPRAEKERIGHSFFQDRRYGSGDEYPEAHFKRNQRQGILPTDFAVTKRNIAIFNSSEDEFAAVQGYENPVYKDQIDGLRQLVCSTDISRDIRFYLRIHPNLGKVKNFQTRAIRELRSDNLVVVGANENVDSYALMERAEKVVTFGSTIGIESAYAGKPSIMIGREAWEDLGACYTPKTHAEAVALINDPQLPARPSLGALKYGYYMVARDVAYEHFDPKTNAIHGKVLVPSTFATRAVSIIRAAPQTTIARSSRRIIRAVRRRLINPLKSLLVWDA